MWAFMAANCTFIVINAPEKCSTCLISNFQIFYFVSLLTKKIKNERTFDCIQQIRWDIRNEKIHHRYQCTSRANNDRLKLRMHRLDEGMSSNQHLISYHLDICNDSHRLRPHNRVSIWFCWTQHRPNDGKNLFRMFSYHREDGNLSDIGKHTNQRYWCIHVSTLFARLVNRLHIRSQHIGCTRQHL